MAQKDSQRQGGWQHMLAGGVAGCTAVLFLHPFDVIKTRLQVQDGVGGALPTYRGTFHAARTILATEGWRGMYAGLTPSLLGSGVSWGLYLYLYEHIKGGYRSWTGQERLGAVWNLLSAAQAGAVVCLMTNPIWLIKTRLALQQGTAAAAAAGAAGAAVGSSSAARAAAAAAAVPYKGLMDAFVRIGREEGLKGYYKGLGPSLLLQTTHGAIQFAAYEELKHLAGTLGRHPGEQQRQLGSLEVSAYGGLSKLAAAISTYPTQVIRSRLQQRLEGRSLVYTSAVQAMQVTWQREGLAGFYKGLLPSLLRVVPQSAVTLTVYEGLVLLLSGLERPLVDAGGKQGAAAGRGQQQQQQQQQTEGAKGPSLTDQVVPLIADTQAEN